MGTNLWGELPDIANERTPAEILREQATALTDSTKGTLVGGVEQVQLKEREFGYSLFIRAPALNNYRVNVVVIGHGIILYPVFVDSALSAMNMTRCENEDDFITALEKALNNNKVRAVISGLLLQTKGAKA